MGPSLSHFVGEGQISGESEKPLSRSWAGEGGPGAERWEGEGSGSAEANTDFDEALFAGFVLISLPSLCRHLRERRDRAPVARGGAEHALDDIVGELGPAIAVGAVQVDLPAGVAASVRTRVDGGKLKPHVSHRLDLADAGRPLALLAERKATGKVVLTTGR
jgi:hypothetical protein